MSYEMGQGQSLERVTQAVWQRRRPLIKRALARLPHRGWARLLHCCARVDRVIKGVEPGREWDELLELVMNCCGPHGLAGA